MSGQNLLISSGLIGDTPYAAQENQPLPVRFAALTHDLGKALTPAEVLPRHLMHEQRGLAPLKALCERLRVPVECRELALLMCAEHTLVHRAAELRADTVLKLFKRADALRRPARFAQLLAACRADAHGRLGFADSPYPQADYLAALFTAAQSVDAGAIARQCSNPADIAKGRAEKISISPKKTEAGRIDSA